MAFPIPVNESQRLAALRALDILDTAPEIAYDEIAELAAQICGCPVGYISFVDDRRRWLKAKYIVEAPRETAVCSTTICGTEVLVVPDMTQDRRFDRSPMVVGTQAHLRLIALGLRSRLHTPELRPAESGAGRGSRPANLSAGSYAHMQIAGRSQFHLRAQRPRRDRL